MRGHLMTSKRARRPRRAAAIGAGTVVMALLSPTVTLTLQSESVANREADEKKWTVPINVLVAMGRS